MTQWAIRLSAWPCLRNHSILKSLCSKKWGEMLDLQPAGNTDRARLEEQLSMYRTLQFRKVGGKD